MGVLEEQERKLLQTHQESHFSNSCAESHPDCPEPVLARKVFVTWQAAATVRAWMVTKVSFCLHVD